MQRIFARIVTTLVAFSLGWSPVGAGAQEATGGASGDNTAVAVNTKDGSSEFRVSFRIVRTSDDVVDQSNIAFAFSSCEGCETVAIAFQVVLVSGSPSTVTPENFAIALNFECTSCNTLASAYQFVLGADGRVHFSAEGNRALSEIRRRLREVAGSDLSFEEMQAELDLLAEDLRTVLAEELLTAGPEGVTVEPVEGPATAEPTPDPTPTVEATTSSSPDASPSPTTVETTSPAETPSSTPPASTEPSPSPSPTPSTSPSATASP